MTVIEAGKNYVAKKQRIGTSSRGDWELIAVADGRDRNEIQIYANNRPSGVKEGQQFNVERIVQVRWGWRRDRNEKWQPTCSIDAIVHPIESEFDTGLTGQSDINWEEMKDADDPWADIADLPM